MLSLLRLERKQKIFKSAISNSHISFFVTDFELNDKPRSYTPVAPSRTIPDPRPKWSKCIPVFMPKRRKNTKKPDGAVHTYTAYIREYPQDRTAKIAQQLLLFIQNILQFLIN